jgi:hypothetical protein
VTVVIEVGKSLNWKMKLRMMMSLLDADVAAASNEMNAIRDDDDADVELMH